MIEHREWVGPKYGFGGLEGQKIAIAGYSHWGSEESSNFTCDVLKHVCEGEGHSFFSSIRSYFGHDDDRAFWESVLFFNTVPVLIGEEGDRYAYGTPAQLAPVAARVLRIADDHRPDKMIAFTTKGWRLWPKFSGSQTSEGTHFLNSAEKVEWGTYRRGDGSETLAFGTRHPQFATYELMRAAVREIVAHRLP